MEQKNLPHVQQQPRKIWHERTARHDNEVDHSQRTTDEEGRRRKELLVEILARTNKLRRSQRYKRHSRRMKLAETNASTLEI